MSCLRRDSRGRLSLPVLYESFTGFKNFFDQLGCGRFHVATQHTLGTGGPKQNPRVSAVAIFGSVKEELHAVAILLAQDGISAELRSRRIGSAADSAVLDL